MDESLRLDNRFWMNQDIPMLNACGEIIFVVIGKDGMDLINNSRGCTDEAEIAIANSIIISHYYYD